jgi:hypothetical protein
VFSGYTEAVDSATFAWATAASLRGSEEGGRRAA